MGTAGHTPNFVATESILPFACVALIGPLRVGKALYQYPICGICDGSVSAYDGTNHAVAGGLVSLQNGEFMQGKAGGPINASGMLVTDSNGFFVESSTVNDQVQFQAAENANAGEVFWVYRLGAYSILASFVPPAIEEP